jgi:hypothetical protein
MDAADCQRLEVKMHEDADELDVSRHQSWTVNDPVPKEDVKALVLDELVQEVVLLFFLPIQILLRRSFYGIPFYEPLAQELEKHAVTDDHECQEKDNEFWVDHVFVEEEIDLLEFPHQFVVRVNLFIPLRHWHELSLQFCIMSLLHFKVLRILDEIWCLQIEFTCLYLLDQHQWLVNLGVLRLSCDYQYHNTKNKE